MHDEYTDEYDELKSKKITLTIMIEMEINNYISVRKTYLITIWSNGFLKYAKSIK